MAPALLSFFEKASDAGGHGTGTPEVLTVQTANGAPPFSVEYISRSSNYGTEDGEQKPRSGGTDLRGKIRWLNAVTAAEIEQIDKAAPPPLKAPLEGVVKAARETDVGPAIETAKRVVDDLQEGFTGLVSGAKEFDPGSVAEQLKTKVAKELAAREKTQKVDAEQQAQGKEGGPH